MFRKIQSVLAFLVAMGCVFTARAQETSVADHKKQITNSIGMKLVLVPSGEFMMGNKEPADDAAAYFDKTYDNEIPTAELFANQHPQHRVRITRQFYLGKYNVTRGQFRKFVDDTGY